jgi:hypothetical protein
MKDDLILKLIELLIKNNDSGEHHKNETSSQFSVGGGDYVGDYVIVRTLNAGVFAGYLVDMKYGVAQLRDSVRLWRWHSDEGENAIALSGVAKYGLATGKAKVDSKLDKHIVIGVIEVIPTTDSAKKSIEGYKNVK